MSRSTSPLTVAVTGAAGFLGSHLVQMLADAGCHIRALVRYASSNSIGHLREVLSALPPAAAPRVRIVHGDILDPRCVRDLVRDCDQVFHLAALIGIPYSYCAPESYMQVNVQGTLNVLEACREECPERVIITSTSEVYGTAVEVPMSEKHPLQAQSPYAASKVAADKFAESYHRSFGLPVVTLRPFNAFGPRQSPRAVVPAILVQLLSSSCETVRIGNLDAVRDMNFATDTVRAFLSVSRAPLATVAGKTYNIATREGRTIAEIAEAAMRATGLRKPIESVDERRRPAASEVMRLVGDADRIRTEVGWRPEVEFDEGLARTARWLTDHPSHFDPAAYRV